jgi:hypothetical protein
MKQINSAEGGNKKEVMKEVKTCFHFQYVVDGEYFEVGIMAYSMNEALMLFAKTYHSVEEIKSVTELLNSDMQHKSATQENSNSSNSAWRQKGLKLLTGEKLLTDAG